MVSQQCSAKVQLENEPFSKSVFIRAVLTVLLMFGYVAAYLAYGQGGLVVLSVFVLLALGHPFWLIRNAQNKRNRC